MTAQALDLASDALLTDVPVHEGYKVLGSVVLYEKIGQGGMGAVYRGKHLRLNVDMAVKVMSLPANLPQSDAHSFTRRFIREAQVAASINHANLIRVSDVNSEGGVYFLVMDYVDGESAGDRLERKRRLSEEETVEICLGAAEGLAEAHQQGIVHRDVKPDNIMIDKKGRVRVTDLGLAKAYSGEGGTDAPSMLTQTQTAMGTPAYMAPEQFMSARSVGPAADVWSLGITLYQLLTGEPPWSDTSVFGLADKVRRDPLPDPRGLCAGISDGACRIIERALRKEPAGRYPDCVEMAAAISRHLASIRGTGKSVLPDALAGTVRSAMVSMTPPASATMTIIANAALGRPAGGERPRARPERKAPVVKTARTIRSAPRKAWVLPAAIAGGAALVLAAVVIVLLVLPRGSSEPGPARGPAPLEAEAQTFYRQQRAGFEAGQRAQVDGAIRAAKGKYDDTTLGDKIRELGRTVVARIAEEKVTEAARKKRDASEAAVRAADSAEKAGDLAEAARQLEMAVEGSDDPSLRNRLGALKTRIAVRQLLDEAEALDRKSEWRDARAKYAEALKSATGPERRQAQECLAQAEKQVGIEAKVAEAHAEAGNGRWREAWIAIKAARKAGAQDLSLDEVAKKVAAALAPRETSAGPLSTEFALVPGGSFMMGSETGGPAEKPVHRVTLSSFYIGRAEVTCAQFEAYRQGLRALKGGSSPEGLNPAVSVSWDDAVAFCKHLSSVDAGGAVCRLPTEAEWEYAARGGPDRADGARKYPWGNSDPSATHANLKGPADGFAGVAPVGSLEKDTTLQGAADMAGNVAEWCADWSGTYGAAAQRDPVGPAAGTMRVVRGGSFAHPPDWARVSARACRRPEAGNYLIGFRVVRELTEDEREIERLAGDTLDAR